MSFGNCANNLNYTEKQGFDFSKLCFYIVKKICDKKYSAAGSAVGIGGKLPVTAAISD